MGPAGKPAGSGQGTRAAGMTWAAILARWLLAAILLATGAAKAADVVGFAAIVGAYGVLPEAFSLPAAAGLTAVELGLSAWLASGVRLRLAAGATLGLHLAYAGWTGAALWRGLRLSNCGCFGVFLARPLGPGTVIEDLVLAAVSLVALQGARRWR